MLLGHCFGFKAGNLKTLKVPLFLCKRLELGKVPLFHPFPGGLLRGHRLIFILLSRKGLNKFLLSPFFFPKVEMGILFGTIFGGGC